MKGESKYIRMRLYIRQGDVASEATNAVAVCAKESTCHLFSGVAKTLSLKKMLK